MAKSALLNINALLSGAVVSLFLMNLSHQEVKMQDRTPHPLLLSSLASCTLITLRMYIDRKGWDIPNIAVNANLYQQKKGENIITVIDRDIIFLSPVDEERKLRLQEISAEVSEVNADLNSVAKGIYQLQLISPSLNYNRKIVLR